jgi:hypothetical protein
MKHTHNIYAIPCKSGFYKTVKCVTSEIAKGRKDRIDLISTIKAQSIFKRLWKGFIPNGNPVLVAKIYE